MKNLTILFLFILAFQSSFSQKIGVTKKDPLTNISTTYTKYDGLASEAGAAFGYNIFKEGENTFGLMLYVTIKSNKYANSMDQYTVKAGSKTSFKLDNDQIIELLVDEDVISCEGCGPEASYPGVAIKFIFTSEQLELFSQNKVVFMRSKIVQEASDVTFSEKEGVRLQKAVNLMINYKG